MEMLLVPNNFPLLLFISTFMVAYLCAMAYQQKKEIKNNAPQAGTNAPAATSRFSLLDYRVQVAILILIGFLFYGNTFSHEAAFDDRMAITDNEYVQQGLAGIPDILTKDAYQSYLEQRGGANQFAGGRYRPLSLITFAIEQQLKGIPGDRETADEKQARVAEEMHSRHVVNVILYITSLIALLYFFRNIAFPENGVVAFVATLIFAIHPIHTEVVANIKSRDEILSVLFITLTFIKSYRYKETKKIKDLLLACLCFFLALLSKEYAITLIALLPLSFYLFKNEPLSFSIKTALPYFIPVCIYLLMRTNAFNGVAAGAENDVMNNPYLFASMEQKIATQIIVLYEYLKMLAFPNVLAADYSFSQIPYADFSNILVYLSLAIHTAMLIAMFLLLRKRRVLGFAIAIYLANLVLVSNLFFNIGAPMGERLIYHSSIGFAMAAGYLLYKGFGLLNIARISKMGLVGFMVVLVAASGFKTIERNTEWKNDSTLFLADVEKVPNSTLANNNAAAACMAYAKENAANVVVRNEWFGKAIKYFDKAIAINPKHMLSYQNRGLCYYNMGIPEKALPDWDTVRKYAPDRENIQKYLGVAGRYFFGQGMKYKSTNKSDSAILAFSRSADATPAQVEPWYELANSYYTAGRYNEAKATLGTALKINPTYAEAIRLNAELEKNSGK